MASEYLRWKYRDVQPETPVELTKNSAAKTGGTITSGMWGSASRRLRPRVI